MEILNKQSFLKIAKTLIIVGYSLCLGSIASFIAMNVIAGDNPTMEFLYWQRHFVNPIMNYVTMPSIWLFLFGNIGLFLALKKGKKRKNIVLLVISLLIVINGQFIIIPLAKSVSNSARQQYQTSQIIPSFAKQKSIEDTCGGLNLLFLISYLGVHIATSGNPKDKQIIA
ncbi:hypothetical protein [Sphingobacterium lactis]|uniref:DUF4149 domain-containing protein n=1 Tax=Sphingobacterium lactis TaxID=797291 RepID=A0A1H5VD50_9SPHI|nr:hypothetical protein [Sphingobacterium lactis]SEF85272.1 hypothetical protein SAMN05421877_10397 [Sphingobacterium lactis]